MEILSPKLNSFGSLSKTSKGSIPKGSFNYEQANAYNKENITDSIRKEKTNTRTEENSNYQTRARSLERRTGTNTQPSYTYNRMETTNPASVLANFSNFFNSPKNVEADLFKAQPQEKNSYRAKHQSKGLRSSFNKDEKSSQSGSSDNYLQSKIDQIINSSLNIKERSDRSKNNSLVTKPNPSTSNSQTFEEKTSEKLNLYTRLLNDMRNQTPKGKEIINQDIQGNAMSKNAPSSSSHDFYSRNSDAKKPYLDLKLSSIDFDSANNNKATKDEAKALKTFQRLSFSQKRGEKVDESANTRQERAEQQQDRQQEAPRRSESSYQKQERLSLTRNLTVNTQTPSSSEAHLGKPPATTKSTRSGLRYNNENQNVYESLSNLKKSLERPSSSLAKSTTMSGPIYNNFLNSSGTNANNESREREVKQIFKSIAPKTTTASSSEVKSILQSFRTVLQRENKPQSTAEEKQNTSVTNKKTLDDETYQNYLKEGAARNEERVSREASGTGYSQRPPSANKSSKYRDSSLNMNRKPEEKLSTSNSTQPSDKEKTGQKNLKDFITQVNPSSGGFPLKPKPEVNVQSNERQSYSNVPGHAQSTKHSNRPAINDKYAATASAATLNLGKTASTTTNSTIAQESKSFTFNASLVNKHGSRSSTTPIEEKGQTSGTHSKKDSQGAVAVTQAVAVCQYYMAGLEKYLKLGSMDNEYFAKIYREHFVQGYQAINFCKYLKAVDPAELAKRKVYLPKKESHKDKKTIIFDLDETLIHCNENSGIPSDVVLPIRFPHGDIIEAGINVRPYAIEALEELSKHFEIIVFTASHSCYANVVLDYLDPQNKYIHHRLFRESCVTTEEGLYVKDLRIFANRNLKDLVIVDNAMYSFGYQLENGIPIIPFYYNKADRELKTLVPYLKGLYHVRDVRDVNIRSFRLHHFAEYESHDDVIKKLFE